MQGKEDSSQVQSNGLDTSSRVFQVDWQFHNSRKQVDLVSDVGEIAGMRVREVAYREPCEYLSQVQSGVLRICAGEDFNAGVLPRWCLHRSEAVLGSTVGLFTITNKTHDNGSHDGFDQADFPDNLEQSSNADMDCSSCITCF